VPWNPAVLEQRIARVHRMGQSKPVRVIHLVTRGSIEERVLKTLDLKRLLFAGVFDGESDDVSVEALGQQQFLQRVRELIEVEDGEPSRVRDRAGSAPPVDPQLNLLTAGVQFLEALAEAMSKNGEPKLPLELSRRIATAVRQILHSVENSEPLE
jgi:hypothetical protein